MDDIAVIELLFSRSETALCEIERKYARLYRGVIAGVLSDEGEIEECASDVLLSVWNTIPPNRPESLLGYLCTIARRTAIDRVRYRTREMRNADHTVPLDELVDALPAEEGYDRAEARAVGEILSRFLRTLDAETRILFIRRYVYLETVSSLAKRFSMVENHIAVKLYRARKKLKKALEREGVTL